MPARTKQKVKKIPTASDVFEPSYIRSLRHETPFFLFSKKKIIDKYHEFKKLFPGSDVHFAMKANSEPEVLKILLDAGSGFEVASMYELNILKKLKVPPGKIVFGTSVKIASHIKEFVKYGVDRFAFDSLQEAEKIAQIAPKSRVYVRTIANDAGSVFKFSEKFGTDPANILPLLLRAKELGLKPYGISFHVGSQASDAKAWANVLVTLRSIFEELRELGITLEVLNLGGGYPCNYISNENIPTLSEISKQTLIQYRKLPYQPKLLLEPGRGIIAEAGILVAKVIARVERRGSNWIFLDVGVYNGLFEAMAYQGSTRYPITCMRPTGSSGESLFELAGPTGDSPDVITREALLPSDTDIGDTLIFHNIGAYSLTTVSEFNGFPKPPVYYA